MTNAVRIEGTCEAMLPLTEPIRPSLGSKGHIGVQISRETIAVAFPDIEDEDAINNEPAVPRRGWRPKEVDSPWPSFDFEANSPATKASPGGSILPRVVYEALPILQSREPELISLKVVGEFRLSSYGDATIFDRWNKVILNDVKAKENRIAFVQLLAGLVCDRHCLGQFDIVWVITEHVDCWSRKGYALFAAWSWKGYSMRSSLLLRVHGYMYH